MVYIPGSRFEFHNQTRTHTLSLSCSLFTFFQISVFVLLKRRVFFVFLSYFVNRFVLFFYISSHLEVLLSFEPKSLNWDFFWDRYQALYETLLYAADAFANLVFGFKEIGWRALLNPRDHPVSNYEFDVLVGADGKRNTLKGF